MWLIRNFLCSLKVLRILVIVNLSELVFLLLIWVFLMYWWFWFYVGIWLNFFWIFVWLSCYVFCGGWFCMGWFFEFGLNEVLRFMLEFGNLRVCCCWFILVNRWKVFVKCWNINMVLMWLLGLLCVMVIFWFLKCWMKCRNRVCVNFWYCYFIFSILCWYWFLFLMLLVKILLSDVGCLICVLFFIIWIICFILRLWCVILSFIGLIMVVMRNWFFFIMVYCWSIFLRVICIIVNVIKYCGCWLSDWDWVRMIIRWYFSCGLVEKNGLSFILMKFWSCYL